MLSLVGYDRLSVVSVSAFTLNCHVSQRLRPQLLCQSAPPSPTIVPASILPIMDSPQRCASQPPPFATKDSTPIVFLPVKPMSLVFDPSQRLQELKDGLNPHSSFYYFYEGQHPNIRAAIKAYEDSKMSLGSTTYSIGGKVVPKAEAAVATTFSGKRFVRSFIIQPS